MELFDAKVKSPVRQWSTDYAKNQAIVSPERQALLDWVNETEEFKTILAADLLLYEHAVDIFRRQTSAALNTRWE